MADLAERRRRAALESRRQRALLLRPGQPAHGGASENRRRHFRRRGHSASLPSEDPGSHLPLQRGERREAVSGRRRAASGPLADHDPDELDRGAEKEVTLSAGSRLGSYEIVSPLGAGGMGEVYRARDTKLDRDVAIKVLPEKLAQDAAALARFEREAKAVAALSH